MITLRVENEYLRSALDAKLGKLPTRLVLEGDFAKFYFDPKKCTYPFASQWIPIPAQLKGKLRRVHILCVLQVRNEFYWYV